MNELIARWKTLRLEKSRDRRPLAYDRLVHRTANNSDYLDQ
jgi:hypothetical protein